jgi:hypothetical protein
VLALFAAYVIALQATLLPLAVAAAAPFATVQCQTSPTPGDIGAACACAAACGMLCCPQALADTPQFGFSLARDWVTFVGAPAPAGPVTIKAEGRPQVARAPPAA